MYVLSEYSGCWSRIKSIVGLSIIVLVEVELLDEDDEVLLVELDVEEVDIVVTVELVEDEELVEDVEDDVELVELELVV